MTPTKARRPRLGTWLALALGALALLAMPGLAAARDRNNDRIPDRWEKRHKLSLKVNQARRDQDRDQLRNRAEFLAGTDPRLSDSDGDGVMDGDEQAGTIASFDAATGRLVIDLFGTDTIAGFVTDSTEIRCEDHSSASASASRSGFDRETEPGDDNGGQGEDEPGDDNGGDSSGPGSGEESGDDNSGPSDNSGPGSESSGPGHDGEGHHSEHGDDDRVCTTAELVPGAVVEEAELKLEDGKATFREVELSGKVA